MWTNLNGWKVILLRIYMLGKCETKIEEYGPWPHKLKMYESEECECTFLCCVV